MSGEPAVTFEQSLKEPVDFNQELQEPEQADPIAAFLEKHGSTLIADHEGNMVKVAEALIGCAPFARLVQAMGEAAFVLAAPKLEKEEETEELVNEEESEEKDEKTEQKSETKTEKPEKVQDEKKTEVKTIEESQSETEQIPKPETQLTPLQEVDAKIPRPSEVLEEKPAQAVATNTDSEPASYSGPQAKVAVELKQSYDVKSVETPNSEQAASSMTAIKATGHVVGLGVEVQTETSSIKIANSESASSSAPQAFEEIDSTAVPKEIEPLAETHTAEEEFGLDKVPELLIPEHELDIDTEPPETVTEILEGFEQVYYEVSETDETADLEFPGEIIDLNISNLEVSEVDDSEIITFSGVVEEGLDTEALSLALPYERPLMSLPETENNLIDFSEELSIPAQEVEDTIERVSEMVQAMEPEEAEATNELLDKIMELPLKIEAPDSADISIESQISKEEIQEELEELFIELFDRLGMDYTPELLETFVRLTLNPHFEELIGQEPEAEADEHSTQEAGTHEFLQKLLQGLFTIKRVVQQAYLIGRSALRLSYFQTGNYSHN